VRTWFLGSLKSMEARLHTLERSLNSAESQLPYAQTRMDRGAVWRPRGAFYCSHMHQMLQPNMLRGANIAQLFYDTLILQATIPISNIIPRVVTWVNGLSMTAPVTNSALERCIMYK